MFPCSVYKVGIISISEGSGGVELLNGSYSVAVMLVWEKGVVTQTMVHRIKYENEY